MASVDRADSSATEGKQVSKKRLTKRQQPALQKENSSGRLALLIAVLLVILTVAAYWPVLRCGFIESFDDNVYVTANPHISGGVTADSAKWAFTTFHTGNWHPLTWISLALDRQAYGVAPKGYHLTNILLHVLNTLLVFFVLRRMTGATWKGGLVAALFAVHPLHVESVAWIAERKDVLSTFLWLTTMYFYAVYAQRPRFSANLAVLGAFALGLMAKPMLVTLPVVLLLMDYWPLDRWSLRWRLLWEKLPLIVMSAASCVTTVIAQRAGENVVNLHEVPLWPRIANALTSYVAYVWKMLWPSRLSVFYERPPDGLPLWQPIVAGILIAAITGAVIARGRSRKYLPVGWLWYLITLVPVIGLAQVGSQAMADRYTYVPLLGLFVMIVWGVPVLIDRYAPTASRSLAVAAVAVVVVLAVSTSRQAGVWQNSFTLFSHAIEATRGNAFASGQIGQMLDNEGKSEEAAGYFEDAVRLDPKDDWSRAMLAVALAKSGRIAEAFGHARTAIKLAPRSNLAHYGLAFCHFSSQQLNEARRECEAALRLDPNDPQAGNLRGIILASQGKLDEAVAAWNAVAEAHPEYPDPLGNMARAYFFKQDYASAWKMLHLFEERGGKPDPGFVADLCSRMPDPQ